MAQVFIKELLLADYNPSLLVSGINETDVMENGMPVALRKREDGHNSYTVEKVADPKVDTIIIANAPVIIEVEGIGRVQHLADPTLFKIPAGRAFRGFIPKVGDTFFLSKDAIDPASTVKEPDEGQVIHVMAGYKWAGVATIADASASSVVGVIENKAKRRCGSGSNMKTVEGFMVRIVKEQ